MTGGISFTLSACRPSWKWTIPDRLESADAEWELHCLSMNGSQLLSVGMRAAVAQRNDSWELSVIFEGGMNDQNRPAIVPDRNEEAPHPKTTFYIQQRKKRWLKCQWDWHQHKGSASEDSQSRYQLLIIRWGDNRYFSTNSFYLQLSFLGQRGSVWSWTLANINI